MSNFTKAVGFLVLAIVNAVCIGISVHDVLRLGKGLPTFISIAVSGAVLLVCLIMYGALYARSLQGENN